MGKRTMSVEDTDGCLLAWPMIAIHPKMNDLSLKQIHKTKKALPLKFSLIVPLIYILN